MSERLLDTAEVMRRLSCGRTHLHNIIRRGEFPEPLKFGRMSRWRESTVDAWIAALGATNAPASDPAGGAASA